MSSERAFFVMNVFGKSGSNSAEAIENVEEAALNDMDIIEQRRKGQ